MGMISATDNNNNNYYYYLIFLTSVYSARHGFVLVSHNNNYIEKTAYSLSNVV